MEKKAKRSEALRVLNALSALLLLGAGIYMIFAGFHFGASVVAVLALVAAATPLVVAGKGVLEVLSGMVEALIDGVVAIFEAIANAISGLFG